MEPRKGRFISSESCEGIASRHMFWRVYIPSRHASFALFAKLVFVSQIDIIFIHQPRQTIYNGRRCCISRHGRYKPCRSTHNMEVLLDVRFCSIRRNLLRLRLWIHQWSSRYGLLHPSLYWTSYTWTRCINSSENRIRHPNSPQIFDRLDPLGRYFLWCHPCR